MNENSMNETIGSNAVSVYGTESVDDFPVLKAFQQYIDAEQSKARKRMVSLCVFFGILMTLVIAVFLILIQNVSDRNQQLNDRLVEYAMRERDRTSVVVQPGAANSANETAMQVMTETLKTLQKQLIDGKKQELDAQDGLRSKNAQEEAERARRAQSESERLKRAKDLLESERRKIAEEKERLRQAEIELQRRRLYPECYENSSRQVQPKDAVARDQPLRNVSSRQRTLTDADIEEILMEVDQHLKTSPSDAEKPKESAKKKEKTADEETDDAVEYFKDDEYEIPVEVKNKKLDWSFTL